MKLTFAVFTLGYNASCNLLEIQKSPFVALKKGATDYDCPSRFAQTGTSGLIVNIATECFGQEQDACDQR
jgi:hypothetical protein